MVLNVGPTKEGKIVPIFEERLRQFGSWLGVNGEAVYSSRPWSNQNDTVIRNIW
jgi:alpha-L-fucosidase